MYWSLLGLVPFGMVPFGLVPFGQIFGPFWLGPLWPVPFGRSLLVWSLSTPSLSNVQLGTIFCKSCLRYYLDQTWRWWSISDGHQFFINSLDGHHIFKSDEMGWWTIKFLTISPSPSIYKLPSKSGLLSKNGGFFRKIWAVTLFKIGVAIDWMWYILNFKH